MLPCAWGKGSKCVNRITSNSTEDLPRPQSEGNRPHTTALHVFPCCVLLLTASAGLASEKIYAGGEQCAVPSTPAASTPQFLPSWGCTKNDGLSSSPMMTFLNGTVPPQGYFQQGMKEPYPCRWTNQNPPVVSVGENAECIGRGEGTSIFKR